VNHPRRPICYWKCGQPATLDYPFFIHGITWLAIA